MPGKCHAGNIELRTYLAYYSSNTTYQLYGEDKNTKVSPSIGQAVCSHCADALRSRVNRLNGGRNNSGRPPPNMTLALLFAELVLAINPGSCVSLGN